MIWQQTILWRPKSKARPRMTKTGHTYTEPATVAAEKNVRDQYLAHDGPQFEGPVSMGVDLYNDRFDLTLTDTIDYSNRLLRGDLDNMIKMIADSLNGVAYIDDKQIRELVARKM